MDLFNSILSLLEEESFNLRNLEKKGDQIEETQNFVKTAKLEQELADTRDLLDSQGHQLEQQKAKFIDFNSFQEKLYELESQMQRELSQIGNLENRISHDETHVKEDQDDLLDTLSIKDEMDQADLDKKLQILESDFFANFDDLKVNLTMAMAEIEDNNGDNVERLKEKISNLKRDYTSSLDEFRNEMEEMGNMTRSIYYNGGDMMEKINLVVLNSTAAVENNTYIIDEMLVHIDYLESLIFNLDEKVDKISRSDEKIADLESKLTALEYGVKIPPHKGEILVTGGDGEYGPKWETSLISTSYFAARTSDEMALPRSGHCMVKFREEIYVVGGSWNSFGKYSKSENSWIELEQMTETRDAGPGCAVFQDRIWICGGNTGFNETDTCESYAPEDGWLPEPALLMPVSATTAAVNSAGLFVIGGQDQFGESNFVQFYDAEAGVWTLWDDLPVFGISHGSATVVNDDIYLVGGNNNQNSILQLDIGSQQWNNATTLNTDRIGAAVVPVDDSIWIIGGSICFDESVCGSQIEIFDTISGQVEEKKIKNHQNVNFGSAILV